LRAATGDIARADDKTPASRPFRSCLIFARLPRAKGGSIHPRAFVSTLRTKLYSLRRDTLSRVVPALVPAESEPSAARRAGRHSRYPLAQDRRALARVVPPKAPAVGLHRA